MKHVLMGWNRKPPGETAYNNCTYNGYTIPPELLSPLLTLPCL